MEIVCLYLLHVNVMFCLEINKHDCVPDKWCERNIRLLYQIWNVQLRLKTRGMLCNNCQDIDIRNIQSCVCRAVHTAWLPVLWSGVLQSPGENDCSQKYKNIFCSSMSLSHLPLELIRKSQYAFADFFTHLQFRFFPYRLRYCYTTLLIHTRLIFRSNESEWAPCSSASSCAQMTPFLSFNSPRPALWLAAVVPNSSGYLAC